MQNIFFINICKRGNADYNQTNLEKLLWNKNSFIDTKSSVLAQKVLKKNLKVKDLKNIFLNISFFHLN